MTAKLVFSTIDSQKTAREIADNLVNERLAACINIIPNVTSVYKWKGAIERADECLLIIKTSEDRLDELTARIKELHPYQVPEVVSLPIEKGYGPYLEWVFSETRG